MTTVNSLLHTSVSDAKITLEGMLTSRPHYAATVALTLLNDLQGKEGQASRRKMAAGILRKAAKALEGQS